MSQFFEILIFSKDISGNVHYVAEINLISKGTLIKALNLPNKTILKKSETQFRRRKAAEDDNVIINVPPNIPCTFLLFRVSAFLQSYFPKKSEFWERQFSFPWFFIPFHIKLFISFIEVEYSLKHQIKEHSDCFTYLFL